MPVVAARMSLQQAFCSFEGLFHLLCRQCVPVLAGNPLSSSYESLRLSFNFLPLKAHSQATETVRRAWISY